MMTDKLQTAIIAIKEGDKSTGKNLLLEILKDNPENDRAWTWMSAVVDSDELRQECLEEAIKHNPNNQTARKGLEKLQKNTTLAIPTRNSGNDSHALSNHEMVEQQQTENSHWQGFLASVGFTIILYGILVFLLNYEPSIWYIIFIVISGGWGRFLGIIVEP